MLDGGAHCQNIDFSHISCASEWVVHELLQEGVLQLHECSDVAVPINRRPKLSPTQKTFEIRQISFETSVDDAVYRVSQVAWRETPSLLREDASLRFPLLECFEDDGCNLTVMEQVRSINVVHRRLLTRTKHESLRQFNAELEIQGSEKLCKVLEHEYVHELLYYYSFESSGLELLYRVSRQHSCPVLTRQTFSRRLKDYNRSLLLALLHESRLPSRHIFHLLSVLAEYGSMDVEKEAIQSLILHCLDETIQLSVPLNNLRYAADMQKLIMSRLETFREEAAPLLDTIVWWMIDKTGVVTEEQQALAISAIIAITEVALSEVQPNSDFCDVSIFEGFVEVLAMASSLPIHSHERDTLLNVFGKLCNICSTSEAFDALQDLRSQIHDIINDSLLHLVGQLMPLSYSVIPRPDAS